MRKKQNLSKEMSTEHKQPIHKRKNRNNTSDTKRTPINQKIGGKPNGNTGKDLNNHFTNEYTQPINIKRCSTALVTKEIQMKSTM